VSIEADSAQGSGFFITEDLVVTCFHVVRGARSIRLKAPGWHGEAIAVVGWDEPDDLAILRITPRRHTKGLRLSNQLAPIGTKVVVVSSPLGLENTVSDGLVSAVRTDAHPRLQFTAPISPGSSGGPVVGESGEVIGVVASTLALVREGATWSQNLNFAVPATRILKVLLEGEDTPVAVFAENTLPEQEARWRAIERSLPELVSTLEQELGARLAAVYEAALRDCVADRDSDRLQQLLESRAELRNQRKNMLDTAEFLASTGAHGAAIGRVLLAVWEEFAAHPTPSTRADLEHVRSAVREYLEALERERARPSFPEAFAGFPFMQSARVIYEWCFPGFTIAPIAGFAEFTCPTALVPPPFVEGPATLSFLNGRLVVVGVDVTSYEKAVEMISAKYGTPTYARWQKDGWYQVERPSFSRNSAFNWTLKGGRIRVGRLNKAPFVLFIRNERDEAVANSF